MLPIPHYDDCQIPLSLRKAVDEAVDAMLKGISVYVAQDCTGMENLNLKSFTEQQQKGKYD